MPFPSAEHYVDSMDHEKRLKAGWADEYVRKHPDGNGVLLPPLKEEVKQDKDAWDKILPPPHDAVQLVGAGGWKDSVAHGLTEHWTKISLAAAGLKPKSAGFAGSVIVDPGMYDKKRVKTMEEHFFKGKIEEPMRDLHHAAKSHGVDPEMAIKLAAAYPDFVRAAIALANVAERAFKYGYGKTAHEKILKKLANPGEIDALIELMESKFTPPHRLVKRFAYPEELEAIYKVHKRFLDMFPYMFKEQKSPFEEFIPEERRKELDEIIELENKLAEGVIQGKLTADHVIPERKYKKLIQLKKDHYSYAQSVLIRDTQRAAQKSGSPRAEERKIPRKGTAVLALFTDGILAEEYAKLVGGNARQVGTKLWRVELDASRWNDAEKRAKFPRETEAFGLLKRIAEFNTGGNVSATFTYRVFAEGFAKLTGGRIVETDGGFWRVEVKELSPLLLQKIRRMSELAKEQRVEKGPEPHPKTTEKPTKELKVKESSESEQPKKPWKAVRESVTLSDLIREKPEAESENGIPFVRNGDQIVVLPPHRPLKELQNLGEEPKVPRGYEIVIAGLEEGLDLETLEKVVNEMLSVIREVRLSGMKNKPRKKLDKLLYELEMWWSLRIIMYERLALVNNDRALLTVLEKGKELVDSYERLKKVKSYRRDNLIYELAMEEFSIAEALKMAKEMLENPEEYGRRKEAAEVLRKTMEEGKVVGFFHRERT